MTKEGKNKSRALFLQRAVAFFIDVLIVSLVATIILYPFSDTKEEDSIAEEATALSEKWINQEIELSDFTIQYEDIYYRNSKVLGLKSLLVILLNVVYFIVYQTYNNGQTFGKKLLKIRVVSENDSLLMNQMIFRSMLANFIIFDLITFVFLLICSKHIYFYSSLLIEGIRYIILIVSVLMVMVRKDGCALHDVLVHTKVIRD